MGQKQQIALFECGEVPKLRPKRKPAPVKIPESAEISRMKDLIERLEFCLLDTVVLASEYVEAAYWSKFLKRTNLNFEYHGLNKILLRDNDFVLLKRKKLHNPFVVKLLAALEETNSISISATAAYEIYQSMQDTLGRPQRERETNP